MATDIPSVQFRPGRDLLVELEARGPSIHQVAKRMCERYLEMVANVTPVSLEIAQQWYKSWYRNGPWTESTVEGLTFLDALERAHVLVERDGFTVAEALVAVGLVQKGTDNG